MNNQIAQNILAIEKRVLAACKNAGRSRSEVKLVAVSKTFPASFIQEAIRSGVLEFGENYIPEGSQKAHEIKLEPPI